MTTTKTLPAGTVVEVGPAYIAADNLASDAGHYVNDNHCGVYTVVSTDGCNYRLTRGVVPASAIDLEDYDLIVSASRVRPLGVA